MKSLMRKMQMPMELTFEYFWRREFCVDPDSYEDKILWLHEADMDIGGGRISIPDNIWDGTPRHAS